MKDRKHAWSIRRLMTTSFVAASSLYLLHFMHYGQVKGNSMSPKIHENDYYLAESFGSLEERVQRGDIVMVRFPGKRYDYIKRVAALPGEEVMQQGKPYTLQQDEFWVLGDNNYSHDSRELGPIKGIVAKLVALRCPHNGCFKFHDDLKKK